MCIALRFISSLLFLWSVFFVSSLSVGTRMFFLGGSARADSIASETAFRSAEVEAEELLARIRSSSENARIGSLAHSGENCSENVLRGENIYGKYSAIFRNKSDAILSCGEKVSAIALIEVTGLFGGMARTIGVRVLPSNSQGTLHCTGGFPSHAVAYSGDESGLATSVSWMYAVQNTSRKCEYACASGYEWNGSSCASVGGGSPVNGSCGTAAKNYAATDTAFSGSYCRAGNPSPNTLVFPDAGRSFTWKCLGANGGNDSSTCVATRAESSENSCSVYTAPTATIPDGYGPPFDELSASKDPTLTVSCSASGAVATAGSSNTYVYKTGFVFHGGAWESVNFSGTPATNNDGWFRGFSTATVPAPPVSGQNFVIAFVCQYQNNAWKCGCLDSACARNNWTIQAYGTSSRL